MRAIAYSLLVLALTACGVTYSPPGDHWLITYSATWEHMPAVMFVTFGANNDFKDRDSDKFVVYQVGEHAGGTHGSFTSGPENDPANIMPPTAPITFWITLEWQPAGRDYVQQEGADMKVSITIKHADGTNLTDPLEHHCHGEQPKCSRGTHIQELPGPPRNGD